MSNVNPEYVRAYYKGVIGCQDNNADIMLTYQDGTKFVDVFINTKAAEHLLKELAEKLEQNKEYDSRPDY